MSTTPHNKLIEDVAINIVHQIGDALYDALPYDIAHENFVDARQATNDIAIDFTTKLITNLLATREAQIYRRVLAALRPQQQEEVCTEQHTTDKSDIDPDYN